MVMVILKIRNYSRSGKFEQKKEEPDNHNRISLVHLVSSLLFYSLLFSSSVLLSLVSPLLFSCLSSCLLLFSLSLSVSVCCGVLFCVVVVCGVWSDV